MKLGVNIDHIATLREARKEGFPDPIEAAKEALAGGADGIVCHLREDRRHIHDQDVKALKKLNCRLDLEMAATPEMLKIALKLKPEMVTIVPEKRREITTEGGLDVVKLARRVGGAVKKLKDAGIVCSAFIEPRGPHIEKAAELGFDVVELWTGGYANAKSARARERALGDLREGIHVALGCGLEVHGGHGLTYRNVGIVAAMPGFTEFNIGHSIISRAVFVGLREAVREMRGLLEMHAPKG